MMSMRDLLHLINRDCLEMSTSGRPTSSVIRLEHGVWGSISSPTLLMSALNPDAGAYCEVRERRWHCVAQERPGRVAVGMRCGAQQLRIPDWGRDRWRGSQLRLCRVVVVSEKAGPDLDSVCYTGKLTAPTQTCRCSSSLVPLDCG